MFTEKTALYVAGSNGSGKSTLIAALSKSDLLKGFVHINPDIILRDNKWTENRKGYIKAYREADRRVEEAVANDRNILRESVTMSPRKLSALRENGYEIYILFIGTSHYSINVLNVANRVAHGGHSVPIKTIIERHENAIKNVQQAMEHSTCLVAFDNSEPGRAPVSCVAISSHAICFQDSNRLKDADWIYELINGITEVSVDESKGQLCRLLQQEMDNNFLEFSVDESSKYIDFSSEIDYSLTEESQIPIPG